MLDNQQIKQLSCTGCKAPLYLYGNLQRSTTVVCQHCGNVMDSQQSFKSLYAFTHIKQSNMNTAYQIGQTIQYQQVDFIVAGQIAYQSRDSHWMQYQLYSASYGYAQLIVRNSETLFIRKTYYLPDHNLWTLKQGDIFTAKQIDFVIEQFDIAEVVDAQGNLTLGVKPQHRNKQCFARQDRQVYVSIQSHDRVEYYIGSVLIGLSKPAIIKSSIDQ